MHRFAGLVRLVLVLLVTSSLVAADKPQVKPKFLFTTAHGEVIFNEAALRRVVEEEGGEFIPLATPITAENLGSAAVVWMQMPSKAISAVEQAAIVAFVQAGGSLFVAADEERRQPLEVTGLNKLLMPFAIFLTGDTPYLHNRGAFAPAGAIVSQDCELPYSGGRAVTGGKPFSFIMGQDGKPLPDAHGSYVITPGGGRVVVLSEGMAPLFLGKAEGQRLSGVERDPKQTVYWGKDSASFNRGVIAWLLNTKRKP